MLIRFTVENFLSFNKRAEFNMIADVKDNNNTHHIIKGKSNADIDLLKTSIIYGANESGKSNLIKAMDFAKKFIINGVEKGKNIDVRSFKLDKKCYQKPSRFEFEFSYKNKQFAYGFSIDRNKIYDEWLFEIGHEFEIAIFERDKQTINLNFEHNFLSDIDKKEKSRINYEIEGTRENLLFLTNCKERNIEIFNEVYEWFDVCLNIIFPTGEVSIFTSAQEIKTDLLGFFEVLLESFGFSIKEIEIEECELEKLKISQKLKDSIKKDFLYGEKNARTVFSAYQDTFIVTEENGELLAFKLLMIREDKDGDDILFDLSEESDGIKRIIEFIPMIVRMLKNDSVFVVDEIERSLHILLIDKLFKFILNHGEFKNVKSQLIASTHEVLLLKTINQPFRKDEVWFVNKKQGASQLNSLANFDISNLDIVKGYINGRFGAIPSIVSDVTTIEWGKK